MCNLRTIKHQEHISGLYLEGGNPARGFVSGLTSSLTASTVQNLGGGKIATVIGGSLSGGVGAAVVGGNFYEGAVFGLIASSLNHVAHEINMSIQESINQPPKLNKIPVPTDYKTTGCLPGFPDAEYKGIRNGRDYWKSKKHILEWDYKRGEIEVYDKTGKEHKGAYNPQKGEYRPNSKVPGRIAASIRVLSPFNIIGAWIEMTWFTFPGLEKIEFETKM